MLTAYAYLADAYLIFIRSLRHCVRINLQQEFESNDDGWWKEPVLKSLANNERDPLQKNIVLLYAYQDHQGLDHNPFEVLDPSHCAKIIEKHHQTFRHVFPDKEEVRHKLGAISNVRNFRFAHPRDAVPHAKDVALAIGDMIYVLEKVPNDAYTTEALQLKALAAAADALALAHNASTNKPIAWAADDPRTVTSKHVASGVDVTVDPQVSSSSPAKPEERGGKPEVGGEPSGNKKRPVDKLTRTKVVKAIRARVGPEGFAPLRYVWSTLAIRHPGEFPDAAYLLEVLESDQDVFVVRRSENNNAVLVAERKRLLKAQAKRQDH